MLPLMVVISVISVVVKVILMIVISKDIVRILTLIEEAVTSVSNDEHADLYSANVLVVPEVRVSAMAWQQTGDFFEENIHLFHVNLSQD